MSVDLAQIERVFSAALEKQGVTERTAYLNEVCHADVELRERVEALLAAHADADNILRLQDEEATVSFVPVTERPGSTIGRYKLLEQIGEGGFGVVFMAEQEQPVRRRVALKIIKAGMDTRQVVARFEAERQALAMMDHPNIAKVLDAGATNTGRPYFVMELVRGVPITEYCNEARLTTEQRLILFQAVCSAVQHAHQKGIIHRDLKPSNVMVTMHDDKAVPKVIDFGVAKATQGRLTERTLFTEFRQLIGTPTYMSPEQAQFSGLDVDTRSDIYSLGVLLYELLTGTTPILSKRLASATYDDLRRLIWDEDPPSPSARLSSLSGEELTTLAKQRKCEPAHLAVSLQNDLDWIVMKCLEKDRTRRYETANGLARDIQRYLNNELVEARAPTLIYRLIKFVRRNKLGVVLGVASIGLLIAAVIGLTVANAIVSSERKQTAAALVDKQAALVEAKAQQEAANANASRAVDSERQAQRQLYASQMNLAMQAWNAGSRTRVLELLESQRPSANEEDLRAFEWYYLWGLCRQNRKSLVGHDEAVLSVAFAPDGRLVATASWDDTVRVWDASTGTELHVFERPGVSFWEVRFSPDGNKLVAGGSESKATYLWDIVSGDELLELPGKQCGFVFGPDGKDLFASSARKKNGPLLVCAWNSETGHEIAVPRMEGLPIGFTPNGDSLITMIHKYAADATIHVYDTKTGRLKTKILVSEAMTSALSADGQLIAVSCHPDTKTYRIYDTLTGELRFSSSGQLGVVRALAFSPDGKRLASGSEDRTVFVWDLETGKKIGQDEHFERVWSVAFSPDGRTVASSTTGGDVSLWGIEETEHLSTIQVEKGTTKLCFSSDGQSIVAIGNTQCVVVDPGRGKIDHVLSMRNGRAITPDGNSVVGISDTGELEIWDVVTDQVVKRPRISLTPGERAEVSPDGKQVALFRPWQTVSNLAIWNLESQESRLVQFEPLHSNQLSVTAAAYSPNGKYLAAGHQFYWLLIWDLKNRSDPIQIMNGASMVVYPCVQFSPTNDLLAAATDYGAIYLYQVDDGKLLKTLRGGTRPAQTMAFSPDSATLAVGSEDTTIRMWDPIGGSEKITLTGHQTEVVSVAFSPDGQILASLSSDGVIKLWEASNTPEASARRPVSRP